MAGLRSFARRLKDRAKLPAQTQMLPMVKMFDRNKARLSVVCLSLFNREMNSKARGKSDSAKGKSDSAKVKSERRLTFRDMENAGLTASQINRIILGNTSRAALPMQATSRETRLIQEAEKHVAEHYCAKASDPNVAKLQRLFENELFVRYIIKSEPGLVRDIEEAHKAMIRRFRVRGP